MPRVTVVIPTCNGHKTLSRAVSSVLNQGFLDLEVIIVDDNREDCSKEISNLFSQNAKVKVVRNHGDRGPARARNVGIGFASGELITFLDDDDCYLQGRIKSLVDVYDQAPGKYSFISSGRFAESGDFAQIHSIPNQKFGVITLMDVFYGNCIDIGFLMNLEFLKKLGGFDDHLASLEDWDLIIRALRKKSGYKVNRYDYCVNRSPGRARVSEKEVNGYSVMSRKHSDQFGSDWALFQETKSLSLKGELSLFCALKASFVMKSERPMRMYASGKLRAWISDH